MIRVLDSAGSTLVEWGRQQQQQQHIFIKSVFYLAFLCWYNVKQRMSCLEATYKLVYYKLNLKILILCNIETKHNSHYIALCTIIALNEFMLSKQFS